MYLENPLIYYTYTYKEFCFVWNSSPLSGNIPIHQYVDDDYSKVRCYGSSSHFCFLSHIFFLLSIDFPELCCDERKYSIESYCVWKKNRYIFWFIIYFDVFHAAYSLLFRNKILVYLSLLLSNNNFRRIKGCRNVVKKLKYIDSKWFFL